MNRNLCAIFVLTLCHACRWPVVKVEAFGMSGSPLLRLDSHLVTPTSTALKAENRGGTRRGFIAAVKRLFVGAGAFSTTAGGRPIPVCAEETDSGENSGNTVEILVTNIDGESDSKGTIKIQLKPEWAPRGVARFEVSLVLFSGMWLDLSLTRLHLFTGLGFAGLLRQLSIFSRAAGLYSSVWY
jgi:hypothetical protein